ncbi:MAG: hypothetical protein LBG19_02250 [Prevotellaceae bacterium]|jgi:hypothetical protein|nr:hypothetical protein [Prevotellaceae bacterium]
MLSIRKPKAKSVRLPFLFALILIVCIALSACSNEEHRLRSLDLLTKAAKLMESDAAGALTALKGVNSAYLEKNE